MNVRGLFAALIFFAGSAQGAGLLPSKATYVLSRGALTLGEARFELAPSGDPGCWRYEYQARPSGLAKLFIGEVTERSDFCIVNGELRSQFFEFKRADKSEDNFTLTFNWRDGVVRSSVGELRPLEPGMIDRLAMQIEVQRWVIAQGGKVGADEKTVTKVEEDRIKAYRFRVTASETIQAPAGKFSTVRVERVDDPKKSTRFWLAPERDYLAIRVEQTKGNSEQIKMLLK
ncbi:MAG: DUF3108 domain-containing protein [Panacagrimonas sp.]